jgi:hypothetical protein
MKIMQKITVIISSKCKTVCNLSHVISYFIIKNFRTKNELIKDFNLLETNIRVKEKNYVYEIKRFPRHRPTAYQHIYYVVLFLNTFFFLLIFMFSSPRRVICIFYHILRYDGFFLVDAGMLDLLMIFGMNRIFQLLAN